MDTHEALTVRTVSAMQRLIDLEARGKTLGGPNAAVMRTALRELETALEELRVASEQLNSMVDEMAEVRSDAQKIEAQFAEFRDLVPLGCVTTDGEGSILDANTAAGELLNVAPRRLGGKPLSLYMVERDKFFALLQRLRFASQPVAGELSVRPRERKPRVVDVEVCSSRAADLLYWFFKERPAAVVA